MTRTRRATPLKLVLVTRGITQRRLAHDLHLNYILVHRLVNGELLPAPKVAARIAAYLDTTSAVLFGRND